MNVISRLFNKSDADSVVIGDKTVPVPKLTIAKWRQLFDVVEALPQIAITMLAARGSEQFTATVMAALQLVADEAIRIVSVLTELDAEYIEEHATINDVLEFIRLTAEKNDLELTLKKRQSRSRPVQNGSGSGRRGKQLTLDEWLMGAAVRLGVSQIVLESEFYMIDLPELLRYKAAETAENRLMALQIGSMSQCTDKDVYGRFVDQLRADLITGDGAEPAEQADRLDRSALEKLRGKIGNRTKGGT